MFSSGSFIIQIYFGPKDLVGILFLSPTVKHTIYVEKSPEKSQRQAGILINGKPNFTPATFCSTFGQSTSNKMLFIFKHECLYMFDIIKHQVSYQWSQCLSGIALDQRREVVSSILTWCRENFSRPAPTQGEQLWAQWGGCPLQPGFIHKTNATWEISWYYDHHGMINITQSAGAMGTDPG